MMSTRFVLVITVWSYQCLPDFLMPRQRKRTVYKDPTENNGSLSGHDLAGQNDTPMSVLTLVIANAEMTLERVPDFLQVSSEYIEVESLQLWRESASFRTRKLAVR